MSRHDQDAPLTHVLPEGDVREHVLEALCPCMPRVRDGVATHNSYDGREVGEVCRRALDLLSRALADEGHEWTDEERDAYERAIDLLNMHHPPADEEPVMEGRRR